jgi:hypothetical protein
MALSALVWSLVGDNNSMGIGPGKGLVYHERVPSGSSRLDIKKVLPADSSFYESLYTEWDRRGLDTSSVPIGNNEVVKSLLYAIVGTQPTKSKSFSCLPINPAASLLQDLRGIQAKTGPANFAKIIQQIYQLGCADTGKNETAASIWYKQLASEPDQGIFKFLSDALKFVGPHREGEIAIPEVKTVFCDKDFIPTEWLLNIPNPFVWFYSSWNIFCKEEWTKSLPRRKWVDWASGIIRTSLGMCYLWEADFYKKLGTQLIGNYDNSPSDAASYVLSSNDPLINWIGPEFPISIRDNNSKIIRLIITGSGVRDVLGNWMRTLGGNSFKRNYKSINGLSNWIEDARSLITREQQRDIEWHYNTTKLTSAMKNTKELINYSLTSRGEYGTNADFYNLLTRKSNRFLVVDPGGEWVVLMSSLAAKLPGHPTTLAILKDSFSQLGIHFNRKQLVKVLEKSGLSKSSHDADEALEIKPSYYLYD